MANEPNYSSNPSKDEPKKEKVRVIPLEYIDEFPGHPFKVLDDESMQKLMNSIEEIGVQSPIVARIKEDQRYEIISGHRRVHACRRLGLKLIPAIVRDLSRDEAIIAIPIARPELKEELFITVAEMRSSGNIRNALDSLDKRIGSAWLSEVVRALETVENSADTTALWASLSMKFKELQRLNLKAQANTVPRKVKKLSMALMMCFLLIYIAVIGQVLMNSLGGIM